MVEGLYSTEDGFLGHAVLRGTNDTYVDVVFATSQSRATELCAKWGTGPFAPVCLSYLEKTEEGSANLAFFQRVKEHARANPAVQGTLRDKAAQRL